MTSRLALRRRHAFAAYLQHLSTPEPLAPGTASGDMRPGAGEQAAPDRVAQPASARFVQLVRDLQKRAERAGRECWLQEALDAGVRVRVWSDLHFEHENIIRYCNRPFTDAEAMNRRLEAEAATLASDGSELMLVLGDWSLAGGPVARLRWELAPTPRALIVGNHDLNWLEGALAACEFPEADALQVVVRSGKEFWFTHYPIRESLLPPGVTNVHGHTHGRGGRRERYIDVSVEATGYRMLDLAPLLDAIAAG